MITLSMTGFDDGGDEIYSVERGSKVKVFLGDELVKSCVYVNITKGVAICVKRDLRGQMMIAQDKIVHELIFGDITVEPVIDEFFTNQKRDNQRVRDLSKNKDRDWFDSCKPDDKN